MTLRAISARCYRAALGVDFIPFILRVKGEILRVKGAR
jgi:hypothetical protein